MIQPFAIVEIFVLLASLVGVLPLYPHLETLPWLMLPIFAVAGIAAQKRGFRVSPFILTMLSIGLFIYYAPRFSHSNVANPASNLLASFLAIRLAGERSGRASLQTCALSIFCLAASTLFTLGPAFLVSLLLLSVLVMSTMVVLTFHETDCSITLNRFELRSLCKLIIWTTAVTMPLMLFFFIILPRTQIPIWNAFAGRGAATGGMSDKVEPGKAESIEQSRAVAFRAETELMPGEALYWRCVVFNNYSSGAWSRVPPPAGETGIAAPGRRVQQVIYAEPGRLRYLPALDPPLQVRASRSSTSGDLVTSQYVAVASRNRYEVTSMPGDTIKVRTPLDRNYYLKLPSDLPPRLAKAAAKIRNSGKSDAQRLSLARDFFMSQNLSYSTSNLPTGKDHLDRFVFDYKTGHCEYFASSLALMMRMAGVPARVVGGYFGGIYNEFGGYYAVREESAHAWTEIFIDGEGWKRVDPSRWSTGFADISLNRGKGFLRHIATLADTFGYFWDVTVITYDLGSQVKLARNAGELLRHDSILKITWKTLLWVIPFLAALLIFYLAARFRKTGADEKLVIEFIRLSGYDSAPKGKGLIEIAAQWRNREADRFALIYSDAIYKDRVVSKATHCELKALLRNLKSVKSKA